MNATHSHDTEDTLLLTPIGSRLYGSSHANSDYDYYRVVKDAPRGQLRKTRARQTIKDGQDNVVLPFSAFVRYAHQATPQALEAMFSQEAIVDRIASAHNWSYALENYRADFHVGMDAMNDTYSRTIYHFSQAEDVKRRFHALRLIANLNEAHILRGRFNPRLQPSQVEEFFHHAGSDNKTYFGFLRNLSFIDFGF